MMLNDFPRLTFGIIVLNGQPFIRYNLRALYPFAHQIIIVEGAVRKAAAIATSDGHSIDDSLNELYRFQEEEDPQNKVEIVTKDDFWSEKDEMSQAYAEKATGDFLWQVDIDEFYQPADMQKIIDLLAADRGITGVSFRQLSFWGGFDYLADGWYLRRSGYSIHRVFRWQRDYQYVTHRPPTVLDAHGRDLRDNHWIQAAEMVRRGIWLYHYPLLFPQQVLEKSRYYDAADWVQRDAMLGWANETYLGLKRPFRVHNVYHYLSWLERFPGQHPPQIAALKADIASGQLDVDLRPTDDIERLLGSPSYRLGRAGLKALTPLVSLGLQARGWGKQRLWKPTN